MTLNDALDTVCRQIGEIDDDTVPLSCDIHRDDGSVTAVVETNTHHMFSVTFDEVAEFDDDDIEVMFLIAGAVAVGVAAGCRGHR